MEIGLVFEFRMFDPTLRSDPTLSKVTRPELDKKKRKEIECSLLSKEINKKMLQGLGLSSEEEACKISNTPWLVTRRLVEIRDIYPAPVIDLQNPWQIKKVVTHYEVAVGKLMLPFADIFEHVFRYWTLDTTKFVTLGHRKHIDLWDVTKENHPKNYHNEGTYIEMLPNQDYALVCVDLFKDRGLSIDDEIGLYWDPRSSNFKFKLIKKGHDEIML
ncbi:hypothetical protein RND71_025986 [Anisodus tanguticus]|uniref:Uncharacterized protein n=1 Tax=Anisodus tanguticus TaxID=243964 RepID=A0AAE1RN22_9SOLA|nr:hypothetical protein RND71_025986 [Anisodus tanguticus]